MLTTNIVPGINYDCFQPTLPLSYYPRTQVSLEFIANLFWGVKRFRVTGSSTFQIGCVLRPYECGGYITVNAYNLVPDPAVETWDFNFSYNSFRGPCSRIDYLFPGGYLNIPGCSKRIIVNTVGEQDTVIYDPPCWSNGPRIPYGGASSFGIDIFCVKNNIAYIGSVGKSGDGFVISPLFNTPYESWLPFATAHPDYIPPEYIAGTIKLITDEGQVEWQVWNPNIPWLNDCNDSQLDPVIPAICNYTLTASREAGDYYY